MNRRYGPMGACDSTPTTLVRAIFRLSAHCSGEILSASRAHNSIKKIKMERVND